MPAETIDDVIEQLSRIIDRSRATASRQGYFPALYRRVTRAVQRGIDDGLFDDPRRMERLDVLFANRYLDAWSAFDEGRPLTAAWRAAFDAAADPRPIVLQHLLLGMNAHINLDLAIAAADSAPGAALADLEPDFRRINQVLAAEVDGVKAALSAIWPKLRVLDWLAGSKDDRVVNFSLTKARDHSWELAQALNESSAGERERRIERADRRVTRLAWLIRKPGPIGRIKTWFVRTGERGSVPEIIDLLA